MPMKGIISYKCQNDLLKKTLLPLPLVSALEKYGQFTSIINRKRLCRCNIYIAINLLSTINIVFHL